MPIRLVVADDNPLILEALQQLFCLEDDFQLLACCRTGTETLQAVKDFQPDVLILDIRMPDVSGLEVFEELTRSAPELARRVVFITGDMREELARSLKASGCGYLVKPFELSELLPLLPKERLPQR